MTCLYVQYKNGLPMSVKLLQTNRQRKRSGRHSLTQKWKPRFFTGWTSPAFTTSHIILYFYFLSFIFIQVNGERWYWTVSKIMERYTITELLERGFIFFFLQIHRFLFSRLEQICISNMQKFYLVWWIPKISIYLINRNA